MQGKAPDIGLTFKIFNWCIANIVMTIQFGCEKYYCIRYMVPFEFFDNQDYKNCMRNYVFGFHLIQKDNALIV